MQERLIGTASAYIGVIPLLLLAWTVAVVVNRGMRG